MRINKNMIVMKNKFLYYSFIIIGVFCFFSYGAENKTNVNLVAPNAENNTVESSAANNNTQNNEIEQESPRRKRSKAVETFLNREGWQSGVGQLCYPIGVCGRRSYLLL